MVSSVIILVDPWRLILLSFESLVHNSPKLVSFFETPWGVYSTTHVPGKLEILELEKLITDPHFFDLCWAFPFHGSVSAH